MEKKINGSEILIIIALIIHLIIAIITNWFLYLYIFIFGMFFSICIYVLFPYLEQTSEFKKIYKSRMRIINLEKKGDNLLIITFAMNKKENKGSE